jgi:hypothetical protein
VQGKKKTSKNGLQKCSLQKSLMMRMWRKCNPGTLLLGIHDTVAGWRFSMELPYELAIPLLGIYPKELKTTVSNRAWCLLVPSLFIVVKR